MADTHRSHVKLAFRSRCRHRDRPEAVAAWPSQLLVSSEPIVIAVEFFLNTADARAAIGIFVR